MGCRSGAQGSRSGKLETVPSETDEITVLSTGGDYGNDGRMVFKASLCCEDRSDLIPDLIEILNSLHLKTLKAEMATLGGRTRNMCSIPSSLHHLKPPENRPSFTVKIKTEFLSRTLALSFASLASNFSSPPNPNIRARRKPPFNPCRKPSFIPCRKPPFHGARERDLLITSLSSSRGSRAEEGFKGDDGGRGWRFASSGEAVVVVGVEEDEAFAEACGTEAGEGFVGVAGQEVEGRRACGGWGLEEQKLTR
ncbi:hypothetical protein LR48_Vigan05g073800 [Vigna angularis]|uniref:Uncharacterized protein n=1 Tax=Phaseolus angularis TaxID=3914 RepID=A0A0L9UKP7_PHAAN|nr:hypothetical protein LR48_Vigan05g073800 [Vigna angularis]